MSIPAKSGSSRGNVLESVLIGGDLALLSEQERVNYYMRVCESLGLNPLTRPFEYIRFQGKLILYARKDCTDQLRSKHTISVKLVSQNIANDIITVHAQASFYDERGRERTDEDVGTLACPATLKGEALAIATMKAVTKAKRRVTLSICGLGLLDETELGGDPGERTPAVPAANVLISPPPSSLASPQAAGTPPAATGGAPAPSPSPEDEGAGVLIAMAREAAERGEAVFKTFYNNRSEAERTEIAPLAAELRQLMNVAKND